MIEEIFLYLWGLFSHWLFSIFVAPFKNLNMLWILVPVYLTWFFAEFYQEKRGTSMGNAITNAVVVFWGGFDWARNTITKLSSGAFTWGWEVVGRFSLCLFVISYGISIIVLGFKGNKLIKYFSRIREVTYCIIIFTPVFYEVVALSWYHVFSAVLFAPVYYFVIELIDKYAPNPKAMEVDLENKKDSGFESNDSFGSNSDFDSGIGGTNNSSSSDNDFGDLGDLKL